MFANGSNYPPDTQIEIATLNDVLFMDRINDLAFVLDGKLVILVEHQSTINKNMPLRFLIYIGRVYERIIIGKIKANIAAGMDREEAFTKAIQECINEGILVNYLKQNGSEVLNMLTQEWDMGKARDIWRMEAREEGRTEGEERAKIAMARRMLANGMRPEDVVAYTELSIEKIKTLVRNQ